MKKVRWVYLMMVAVTLFLLAGCGSGSTSNKSAEGESNEGVVTLKVWDYVNQPAPEKAHLDLLSQFEESHPNIKIERTYFPFADLKTKLLQGVAGNDLPDLVIIDNPDHQAFAEAGVFADITEEIQEWGEADIYFDGPMASTMLDGKYYGLPRNSNSLALFYNKDLFEEAGISGPPETWEELKAAAKKVTNADRKGLAISAIKTEEGTFQYLPFLWQSGADLNTFDSADATSSLELLQDMVKEGSMSESVLNWNQEDVMVQFRTGKAAMMVNLPWQIPILRDEQNINWDVVPLPKGKQSASVLGGENWAITSSSKHKKEAWEFLMWSQKSEVLGPMLEAGGYLPSRKDLAEDSNHTWTQDEQLGVFAKQIEVSKPRAYGTNYPEISTFVQEALQQALIGGDVKSIMEETAKEINPLLP